MFKLLRDMNLKLLVLSKLSLLILLKLFHVFLQFFHLLIVLTSFVCNLLSLSIQLVALLLLQQLLLSCCSCILFLVIILYQILDKILQELNFLDAESLNI